MWQTWCFKTWLEQKNKKRCYVYVRLGMCSILFILLFITTKNSQCGKTFAFKSVSSSTGVEFRFIIVHFILWTMFSRIIHVHLNNMHFFFFCSVVFKKNWIYRRWPDLEVKVKVAYQGNGHVIMKFLFRNIKM